MSYLSHWQVLQAINKYGTPLSHNGLTQMWKTALLLRGMSGCPLWFPTDAQEQVHHNVTCMVTLIRAGTPKVRPACHLRPTESSSVALCNCLFINSLEGLWYGPEFMLLGLKLHVCGPPSTCNLEFGMRPSTKSCLGVPELEASLGRQQVILLFTVFFCLQSAASLSTNITYIATWTSEFRPGTSKNHEVLVLLTSAQKS